LYLKQNCNTSAILLKWPQRYAKYASGQDHNRNLMVGLTLF
jgi:hypothetical protein